MVRDKKGRLVDGRAGRPRVSDSEKRRNRLQIMINDEMMAALTKLAKRHGRSVSDFGRYLMEEGIERETERGSSGYFEDYDDEY